MHNTEGDSVPAQPDKSTGSFNLDDAAFVPIDLGSDDDLTLLSELIGKTRKLDAVSAAQITAVKPAALTGLEHPFDLKQRDRGQHFSFGPLARDPSALIDKPPIDPLEKPYTAATLPDEVPEFDHPELMKLAMTVHAFLREHPISRRSLFLAVFIFLACSGVWGVSSIISHQVSESPAPTLPTLEPTISAELTSLQSTPTPFITSAPMSPSVSNQPAQAPAPAMPQASPQSSSAENYFYDPAQDALIYEGQNRGRYAVKPGDTLYDLALWWGYCDDYQRLANENAITNPDDIEIGQILEFKDLNQVEVRSGETVAMVAERCAVTPEALAVSNNLQLDQVISPGTLLFVPR